MLNVSAWYFDGYDIMESLIMSIQSRTNTDKYSRRSSTAIAMNDKQ